MTKNVEIITYFGVHNHGALLQMYALDTLISKMGYSVDVLRFPIDYRFHDDKKAIVKYSMSIKSIPYFISFMLQRGIGLTLFNIGKKNRLDRFRKNPLFSWTEIDDNTKYDVAIIGSDEVFSIENGLTKYFWGEELHADRICSYAGCFGPTTIQDIEKKEVTEYLRKQLSQFAMITTRDKNSADIVQQLAGIEAEIVIDPVLLYGYKKEIEEAADKIKDKNYILVYSYDKNMNEKQDIEAIRHIAKVKNKKIYSVGFYHKWCDKNINVDPMQLLGYIKKADYIITDTFHGSVMSIICQKDFTAKIRNNANKLEYLLSEYELDNRMCNSLNDADAHMKQSIDYSRVNHILEERRKKAMKYLQKLME